MKTLLALGVATAILGFVATGIGLAYRFDAEAMAYVWAIPRDALFQWHTTFGGILVAAGLTGFLPMDWFKPTTERERIASIVCLTALWCMILYVMGRH